MKTLDNAIPHIARGWLIEPLAAMKASEIVASLNTFSHLREWKKEQAVKSQGNDSQSGNSKARKWSSNGSTAYLKMSGVMTEEEHSLSDMLEVGGTTYSSIRQSCDEILNDPNIKTVFAHFITPGGEAIMCHETYQALANLNKKKPIMGYASQACSAGLYLLSACEWKMGNDASTIGSMGTRLELHDISKMLAEEGIEVIPIDSSGEEGMKSAGLLGTEITQAQRDYFTRYAEAMSEPFSAAVQVGFNLSDDKMKTLKKAEVYVGKNAKSIGLLDKLGSPEDALKLLQSQPRKKKPVKGAKMDRAYVNGWRSQAGLTLLAEDATQEDIDAGMPTPQQVIQASNKSYTKPEDDRVAIMQAEIDRLKADARTHKELSNREVVEGFKAQGKVLGGEHFESAVKARQACVDAGCEAHFDKVLANGASLVPSNNSKPNTPKTGKTLDADTLADAINASNATTDEAAIQAEVDEIKASNKTPNKGGF